MDAIPVSKAILDKLEAKLDNLAARNVNPFSLKRVFDFRMHGSNLWVGKYDQIHHGDYI